MPAPNSGLYIIASLLKVVGREAWRGCPLQTTPQNHYGEPLVMHLPAAGRRKIPGQVVQQQHPVWPAGRRGEAGAPIIPDNAECLSHAHTWIVPPRVQLLAGELSEVELHRGRSSIGGAKRG